jgi:hypothetical protein
LGIKTKLKNHFRLHQLPNTKLFFYKSISFTHFSIYPLSFSISIKLCDISVKVSMFLNTLILEILKTHKIIFWTLKHSHFSPIEQTSSVTSPHPSLYTSDSDNDKNMASIVFGKLQFKKMWEKNFSSKKFSQCCDICCLLLI